METHLVAHFIGRGDRSVLLYDELLDVRGPSQSEHPVVPP